MIKLEELEKRIQALEDLEEIKRVKVRYAKYMDDNFNIEKLMELFTDDAEWSSEAWGSLKGKEAIRRHFEGVSKRQTFSCHRIVAPDIIVEGDKAHGTWYGMCTGILSDGRGFWSSSLYTDEYRKVDGRWLISKMKMSYFYRSPYEGGWAKERNMALKSEK